MEFSVILNWILGGGLLAAVIGVATLKATLTKANAEAERAKADAEKAKAEAESVRIDNAEHATRILMENIVEPLKTELSDTRKELLEVKKEFGSTKREMARFRKAVETANSCHYSDDCPVLSKLRDTAKNNRYDTGAVQQRTRGQPRENGADDNLRSNTDINGDALDTAPEPP